jgi:hypothetical protein
MTARLLADEAGTWSVTGVHGGRSYRGAAALAETPSPVALDGSWSVRLDQPGAEPVDRELGSWTTFEPKFSGTASYVKEVELDAADLEGRRMVLDLGKVHDLAAVTVNGVRLPTALWSPYVVDVTEALRTGTNRIEVRVTNTLANERNKILASGLVGPVFLRPRAILEVEMEAAR